MKLFAKCQNCKQQGFIIKKRVYNIKKQGVGTIKSQNELCRTCYKKIKLMLS